jgi:hypothetical protein
MAEASTPAGDCIVDFAENLGILFYRLTLL